MGGMGRLFDGGYAEYCVVPVRQVQAVTTELPWEIIGAIPEMLQTPWGSLFKSLKLKKGDRLLVRGGTTSVGLAAASIAHKHGCYVAGTTRRKDREAMMKSAGCDEVFVDGGHVSKQIGQEKDKFDKVLELVGTTSLLDSLQCVKEGGSVCMTGMVGNAWELENFMSTPLEELAAQIKEGTLKVKIGKVFRLDEIVEAHRVMEENTAGGKIVVLT
jgi:NADPH:quinone reductase-like Zn-dependent oxidoreductase